MKSEYTVVDNFSVKGRRILVLDKKRTFTDFNTSEIVVDGTTYPYQLTHNDYWIVVDVDEDFSGKQITFKK